MSRTPAEAIRNAYQPDPWWAYLALTAFFVSYGLGRDLNSGWATVAQAASWVILAGAAWAQWRKRASKGSVAQSMRMTDAVDWIVVIGFMAATLAVLFGGPLVLAGLGAPFPHAISGLAVGLMLVAAIPLGGWSVRRAVARVEAGSDWLEAADLASSDRPSMRCRNSDQILTRGGAAVSPD